MEITTVELLKGRVYRFRGVDGNGERFTARVLAFSNRYVRVQETEGKWEGSGRSWVMRSRYVAELVEGVK